MSADFIIKLRTTSADYRPLYDYNKPIGEFHYIGDIFVAGTEMNLIVGKEDVKCVDLIILRNRENADWHKSNWAIVSVSETQLSDKEFTVILDMDNIAEIVSKNYKVVKKAYAAYVKEVKKRLREE